MKPSFVLNPYKQTSTKTRERFKQSLKRSRKYLPFTYYALQRLYHCFCYGFEAGSDCWIVLFHEVGTAFGGIAYGFD